MKQGFHSKNIGEVHLMKKQMKNLIYRIWVRKTIKEAENQFFEVTVWDEIEHEYIESLSSTSIQTLAEAMDKLQQVIEEHPQILFKPNASGRLIED